MPVKGRVVRLVGFGLVLALAAALLPSRGVSAQSVPGRPSGLSVVSVAHDSVALVWDDPGDASVTHYRVLRRDRDVDAVGVFATIEDDTGSAAVSFVDEGAEPSRRYVYRVVAVSEHVESPRSGYVRVDTPAAPVSPGLSGLSGVMGGTRASPGLLWSATMTAGVAALGAADYFGYSEFTSTGALDPTGFDYDGDRVDVVYFGHVPSSGDLYLGLRGPVVGGAVLGVGGAQFALADASVDQVGPAWRYRWDAAGIAWGPGDRVEVRLGAVGADEAVPEPPTGFRALMLYGAVQLSWDAAPSSGGVDASYQVWREDTGPGAAGLVQLVQVDGAAYRDSVIAAGSAYRYGVSLRYGQGARSAVSGTVTVQVPPLLADSAPGLERIAVGTSPGVALDPGRSRYDVTLDGPGGETRVELQANAFDAALQSQVVRADDLEVRDQDLAAPVALSEHGDTLMIVRVVSPDGHRRRAYVLRLRPPGDTSTRSLARSASPATRTNHLTQQQATDPRLSALGVSPGSLMPAFAADTFEYTVAVSHDTAQITVAATPAADAAAMVAAADADAVTEGHQVALNAAEPGGPSTQTAIIVVVSNGDRLDSYTIVVNRAAPPSDDTTLSALALTGIELQPAFDAATAAYTATVAHHTETVTVTVTANHNHSRLVVSPPDADPVMLGHQVSVEAAAPGQQSAQTLIAVAVTAQDGTRRTYAVTVTRPVGSLSDQVTMELPEGCVLYDLGAGDETPRRAWHDGCDSLDRTDPQRAALYYRLYVGERSEVRLRVHGETSSHLLVRSASGLILAHDGQFDNPQYYDARLTRTLPRGVYVIEVAAHWRHLDRGHRLEFRGSGILAPLAHRLDALSVSDVNLANFNPGTGSYHRNVAADVTAVTVTATPTFSESTVAISPPDSDPGTDAHEVALDSDGLTELTVTVASPQFPSLTTTYTVALNRLPDTTSPLSDDNRLSALSLTGIDIGAFDPDDENYSYTLGFYDSLNGLTATVAATTAHSGATWEIHPADADPAAAGHQVNVNGNDTIEVTVSSQDNDTRRTYTIEPGPPATRPNPSTDVCYECGDFSNHSSRDLRANGDQITVVTDYPIGSTFYTFDMNTGDLVEQFTVAGSGSRKVNSFWTDGETLWVTYWWGYSIYAYSYATKARLPAEDISRDPKLDPNGSIWSDGTTMYINKRGLVEGYDIATKQLQSTVRLQGSWHSIRSSMWSDGTTLWVASEDVHIMAYDLRTGARVPGLDLKTNTAARGIWSDGATVWVLQYPRDIKAYTLPENARLKQLSLDVGVMGLFNNGIFEYQATVPSATTTVTVTAEQAFTGGSSSVAIDAADADAANGHQVSLNPNGPTTVTVTVTAPNGTDTEIYTVTVTKEP